MVAHGNSLRGEKNLKAKLTEQQVLAIFRDRRPLADIAIEYGCSIPTVSSIRTGKNWSWLTTEHA